LGESLVKYATWLTFSSDDEEYLTKVIRDLGTRHSAPCFVPHITIYGLVQIKLFQLEKIVKKNSEIISFPVRKQSILQSENFWKTVYIQISRNRILDELYSNLSDELKNYTDYEFNPHISLIYKTTDVSERKKIIRNITVRSEFHISGLAIQEFDENIQKWRIVRKYDLQ